MRTTFFAMFLLATSAAPSAQNAVTALSALRLIPRPDAKRLVRIEAREGKPAPERWYFLIHDPQAESGLREYVIAGGEIVAMRGLSQFAEAVAAPEVIGSDALKIDSDKLARVAEQYAEANGAKGVLLNYRFAHEGAGPAWTVTCVDATGKRLGEVVFDAAKGDVLAHGGFPKAPGPEKDTARVARSEERPRERKPAEPTPRKIATPTIVRAEPVATPAEKRGAVEKIGNSFQRMFGGGR